MEDFNGSFALFKQMNCHLIIDLGGPTGSDNTFTGPLGKKLNSVEDLDYNSSFKVISGGPDIPFLPQDVIDDFSTDQQYGFKMVEAIKTGSVQANVFFLAIGKVSHARWLTTANRFLGLNKLDLFQIFSHILKYITTK